MRTFLRSIALLLLLAGSITLAQTASPQPPDIGLQQYHDYHGGDIDHINIDNGNLTLTIPLVSYPQRGSALKMDFGLVYNGTGMVFDNSCTTEDGEKECDNIWTDTMAGLGNVSPFTPVGGPALFDLQDMSSTTKIVPLIAKISGDPGAFYNQYIWYTPDGGSHGAVQTSTGQISFDGTNIQAGFLWDPGTDPLGSTCSWDCSLTGVLANSKVMATRDGITYFGEGYSTIGPVRMDMDGNYISSNGAGYTDTVGRYIPFPTAISSPTAAQTTSCTGSLPVTSVSLWTPPGYTEPFIFCYAEITEGLPGRLVSDGATNDVFNTKTQNVLQSVVLPNGQAWTFGYTEEVSGCLYSDGHKTNIGDLTHITFPTGGTIDYTYTCTVGITTDTTTHSKDRFTTAVASRTVNANDGRGGSSWTYTYWFNGNTTLGMSGITQSTTITDPLGNQTVNSVLVSPNANGVAMHTGRVKQQYSGSASGGTLLRTQTSSYFPQYQSWPLFPLYLSSETTTLENGQSTQTVYQICCDYASNIALLQMGNYRPVATSYGKVTDAKVYDYTTGTQETLLKETATSYLFQSNTSYMNPGLIDLVSSQTIYNGSGTKMAQASYGYDQSSRATSGIASLSGIQITTPIYGVYGHQTSKTSWLNTGSTSPTTTVTYYDSGEVCQVTDPLGHATTTSYSSTYLGALPTTATNALGQQSSFTYRTDTGQKLTTKDPNGQITTNFYSDSLNRLTSIEYPDGGMTNIQYNDSENIGVTVTRRTSSSVDKQTQAIVDGLGRLSETILLSDPAGPTYTRTTYDALGRKYQVWNPTRCSPSDIPCTSETTWGITTYGYDALGRKTSEINPDNTVEQWCYNGVAAAGQTNCHSHLANSNGEWVDVTDENGNDWQRTTNALGELTNVVEPNGATTVPSMESDYSYDALNNLLSITQWGGTNSSTGARMRSFNYDSLSRLLTAINPETGTVSYVYDPDGNVISKTDARGVTTNYAYDALNRILSKNYSDGATPSSCYVYDSLAIANGIERLASEWTQSSSTACSATAAIWTKRSILAYDAMGRVLNEQQCTPSNCTSGTSYARTYTYDFAGNQLTFSDGIAPTSTPGTQLLLKNEFDAAGHLLSLTSNWINTTHPAELFSAPSYAAPGGLTGAIFGNGLSLNRTYNNRLRITGETDTGGVVVNSTSGSATVAITGAEQTK